MKAPPTQSTLQTHAEAIVFERFKHLTLDRYTLFTAGGENRVVLFFSDGSFRVYSILFDFNYQPVYYSAGETGRFRNARTGQLIRYSVEYNSPTFINP